MYCIYVNNKLISTKDDLADALKSYERLVKYFTILKNNYIKMNITIEEKTIQLINIVTDYIVQQEIISNL